MTVTTFIWYLTYYFTYCITHGFQKRIKAAEAETKLKQVYIPNYNKPNPAQITGKLFKASDFES